MEIINNKLKPAVALHFLICVCYTSFTLVQAKCQVNNGIQLHVGASHEHSYRLNLDSL